MDMLFRSSSSSRGHDNMRRSTISVRRLKMSRQLGMYHLCWTILLLRGNYKLWFIYLKMQIFNLLCTISQGLLGIDTLYLS